MIEKNENDLKWLEFDIFKNKKLKHGIYFGKPNFDLSDSSENKNANFNKIKKHSNSSALYSLSQCHSNIIHKIDYPIKEELKGDGLTTSKCNIGLMIRHADCQASIIYDPKNHIVANIHVGWKGNVFNFYQTTVSFLITNYGSNPKDLLVGISPSLGPTHAEFIHYKEEFPLWFTHHMTKDNHFNLWDISKIQLEQAGIPHDQIEIARICTYANDQHYFSYRRNQTTYRHGTVVNLL